jgi:anti-sigma regulatory factor (Ser/Thr protein kinase)
MRTYTLPLLFILFQFNLFAHSQDTNRTLIKQVFINDKSIDNLQEIKVLTVKALEEDLVFEFVPHDSPKDSAIYTYFLKGFDDVAKKTHHPTTRYTRLKGGDYDFSVKCNNDTLTSRIKVHVERSLDEEWWFYPSLLLYGLLIAGAITYFWNIYNLRQKLKVQTIRNHIAADLHDEVGATLSSIGISIRTIQKRLGEKDAAISENLERMKTTTDETNRNLRDTVWSINPDNDSFQKVFERMSTFAYQILQDQEIHCTIDNHVDMTKPFKISMEQRQNVYLIFKEAVNNIAKHSEAAKAHISLKREKNDILLTIQDDGKGFNITENYEGNGLKNYRRRAKESFIEFDIKSTPSVGTVITLLIPEL